MARVLSKETTDGIAAARKKYPTSLGALLPALHLVQKQLGYVSEEAQFDVAEALDVPPARVREVVTFYTMFYDHKTGRHLVKICRNLACQLRGAEKVIAKAEEVLGIKCGETTPDGKVTLEHEECLASCGTGPMLWCNDEFVENLNEQKIEAFLRSLP